MRVLHPVTQRERLVASGVYRYSRGGQRLTGAEHFSVHALPDGSWFARIDYDWRELDHTSQLIEALYDDEREGGRIQRVSTQFHGPDGVHRETTDFHPRAAFLGLSSVTGTRQDIEVSLPAQYVALLLKTPLIGIQAERWPVPDGERVTAFCGYRTDLGGPLIVESRRRGLGNDTLIVSGRAFDAAVVEIDGEYTQRLWLASGGVVLRRQIGEMDITIENLALGQHWRST